MQEFSRCTGIITLPYCLKVLLNLWARPMDWSWRGSVSSCPGEAPPGEVFPGAKEQEEVLIQRHPDPSRDWESPIESHDEFIWSRTNCWRLREHRKRVITILDLSATTSLLRSETKHRSQQFNAELNYYYYNYYYYSFKGILNRMIWLTKNKNSAEDDPWPSKLWSLFSLTPDLT